MWSKTLPTQSSAIFHRLRAGSVSRFGFVFQVGWIVTLPERLCKDYLAGQVLKICGSVNKEGVAGYIPSAFLVWHLEIVQVFLELILCRKASVAQISRLRLPFMQSPIIEHFQLSDDDFRIRMNNALCDLLGTDKPDLL
jgi:hypothetical protein